MYYSLPPIHNIIEIYDITLTTSIEHSYISQSLHNYLNMIKKQIDHYSIQWDIYKKYTNPYEYIHTIIPYTKQSVCKFKPLSRSFYKFIEIYNLFYLSDILNSESIKSFHLAEGPGGFIEAINLLRENTNDVYYGMTLIDNNNDNIPGWKKSKQFLLKNNNVIIESGIDNTGDLFNVNNLWHCYNKYKNTINIVTGDGGFDFSIDFNQQEILSTKLIFCQICYALAVQKKGGVFILKCFDIFTQATLDLIYILSSMYETVNIFKPQTSRIANSEKYIICKNFKVNNTFDIIKHLSTFFPIINSNSSISRFLNIDIPYIYVNKLEDINAIIGQQQLENILSTLYLLDNNKPDKLDTIKKNNIQKCIQWCIKNNLPHNKNVQQYNIFLSNKESVN